MPWQRTMVVGAVLLWVLGVVGGVQAQTPRGQAYAVQCIGFAGGYTLGSAVGAIHLANSNSKYGFTATCDSRVNGGQALITGPEIPASAGPVTYMSFLVTTIRVGTFYREKPHNVQSSTGFVGGTFMADPATVTGEVHVLISVP